jgi:predicted aspartyl protease
MNTDVMNTNHVESSIGLTKANTITLRHPFALASDGNAATRDSVQLDLALDTKAAMLLVPASVSQRLGLPTVRRQALHEAAMNETGERKPVLAVELEINGIRAIFEAIVEPNISNVVVSPSLLDSLALERKN